MGYFDREGLIPVAVDTGANGILRLKEIGGGRGDGARVGRDFAQRGHVVEYPEAAAVRTDDEVVQVVRRVDFQVTDGGAGQVLAQRLPVVAVVEADVNGCLGAGEKQARLLGIGAHNIYPASRTLVARQAVNDAGPSLTAIGGSPDERHVGIFIRRDVAAGAALASDAPANIGGAYVI